MLLAGALLHHSATRPTIRVRNSDYNENLINSATRLTPETSGSDTTSDGSIVPTTKTVIVADDTAFVRDRFATALAERRAHGVHRQERRGTARPGPRRPRAHRPDRPRSAAASRRRGRAGADDPEARRRPAADPRLQRHDRDGGRGARAGRARASPATSTSTARSSTSCRRSRRTCFPTTSTAAAARASCSASRSRTGSATRSPRR